MKGIIVALLFLSLSPSVSSQKFLGYWELIKEDGDSEQNPTEWIGFYENGTYALGRVGLSQPGKIGEWVFDKKENSVRLFLDNRKIDDGKYVIEEVSDDKMTMSLLWKKIHLVRNEKAANFHIPPVNIEVKLLWRYDFAEGGYPNQRSAIDDKAFYFGSDLGNIRALDKETGKRIWEANTELGSKGFFHTIAQDDEYLYCNGTQGNIYKIDKKNGEVVWTVKTRFDDDVLNKINVVGDMIYANPVLQEFFALNKDGEEVWKTKLPDLVFSYTIHNDKIYANVGVGSFMVLDASNGRILTTKEISGKFNYYPEPAIAENTVIISDLSTRQLKAFDSETMREKWIDSTHQFLSAYESNGVILAISNNQFARLSPADGSILWEVKDKYPRICDPVVFDDKVYLQSREKFIVIDVKSGKVLYESDFKHKSFMQPLVTKDAIYMGYNGKIMKAERP